MSELIRLWQRAITAELCWLEPCGAPAALAVTPLMSEGKPAVALPYRHAGTVAGLRRTQRASFVVTDSRSLRDGSGGRAATGRVELADDTDGDLFADEMLEQELLKYPPSRALADSPLLRRENWWWLPRIVVRLEAVSGSEVRLPTRTNPHTQALLVRDSADGRALDVVRVRGGDERMTLSAIVGGSLRGDASAAMLFGYDYSMPDLERWEPWSVHGKLLGDELVVSRREGSPDADLAPLTLLRRVRQRHELSRACRKGIAATENAETAC